MNADIRMMNDVHAISEADKECLMEVAAVLQKHGALNRFGVTLLHRHFEIAEDEVLVEDCDREARTLTSRPVKESQLARFDAAETNWCFVVDPPTDQPTPTIWMKCIEKCVRGHDGSHDSVHFDVT